MDRSEKESRKARDEDRLRNRIGLKSFEEKKMAELSFSYDANKDLVTVEGMKYSGDFFRNYARENYLPTGILFTITKRGDGVVWIKQFPRSSNGNEELYTIVDELEVQHQNKVSEIRKKAEREKNGEANSDGAV